MAIEFEHTQLILAIAGNFLPWGESRQALAPAPSSVWIAEASDALQVVPIGMGNFILGDLFQAASYSGTRNLLSEEEDKNL